MTTCTTILGSWKWWLTYLLWGCYDCKHGGIWSMSMFIKRYKYQRQGVSLVLGGFPKISYVSGVLAVGTLVVNHSQVLSVVVFSWFPYVHATTLSDQNYIILTMLWEIWPISPQGFLGNSFPPRLQVLLKYFRVPEEEKAQIDELF